MPVSDPLTLTSIASLFYDLFVSYTFGNIFLAGFGFFIIVAWIGRKANWSMDTYIVVFIPFLIFLGVTALPINLMAYVAIGAALIIFYAIYKIYIR